MLKVKGEGKASRLLCKYIYIHACIHVCINTYTKYKIVSQIYISVDARSLEANGFFFQFIKVELFEQVANILKSFLVLHIQRPTCPCNRCRLAYMTLHQSHRHRLSTLLNFQKNEIFENLSAPRAISDVTYASQASQPFMFFFVLFSPEQVQLYLMKFNSISHFHQFLKRKQE